MRSSRLNSCAASASILIDLGGLVGDADLDQLVQLLVDAAFEQSRSAFARRRRGGRGCATARPRRADRACAEIRCLICVEPVELGGFRHLAFLGADHGELFG